MVTELEALVDISSKLDVLTVLAIISVVIQGLDFIRRFFMPHRI